MTVKKVKAIKTKGIEKAKEKAKTTAKVKAKTKTKAKIQNTYDPQRYTYPQVKISVQMGFDNILNYNFYQFLRASKEEKIVFTGQNLNKIQIIIQKALDKYNRRSLFTPFLNKMTVNLINYNSLQSKQENNLYIFNHESNENSKKIIDFALNYVFLLPQDQEIDQQNQVQLNVKQPDQDKRINSPELIISQRQLLNLVEISYKEMQKMVKQMVNLQQRLSYFINQILLKEKMKNLLKILQIHDKFNQNAKKQYKIEFEKMVCEILLLKLIKSHLLSLFIIVASYFQCVSQKFTQSTKKQLYYCKLLGKKSRISNFLQIQCGEEENYKTQKRIFEECCAPLFLNEQQVYNKYICFIHKMQTFEGKDKALYLIDTLRFIKSTFQFGLGIKILKQNLFISNKIMKYKINEPFLITKSINSLKSDDNHHYFYKFISQNLQTFLHHKIIVDDIHQTDKRRQQHFLIVQYNIQMCFELFDLKQQKPSNYQQKDKQELKNIYQYIKSQLNQLKQQIKGKPIQNEDIQKYQKNQLIQKILISKIDLLIGKSLKNLMNIPYNQSNLVLKSLNNINSYCDFLYEILYLEDRIETDTILQKIATQLKDINRTVDSGIIGVKQIKSDQNTLLIQTDLINPKQSIILSEFNPEVARKYIFELCLPSKHFQKPKQNQQPKLFTFDNAMQVVQNFIKRIQISFANLSKRQIKCPIFLSRHLIIRNKWNKENYPIILPQLNIIHCYLDDLLLNKIKRPTQNEEYYINYNIKLLQLSPSNHNQLIFMIFLFSLIRTDSECIFLQKVSKFFHLQFLHILNLNQIIKALNQYLTGKQYHQHTCIFFSQINGTTIIPIFKNRIMQRLQTIRQNVDNDKQLINISLQVFTMQQRNILQNNQSFSKFVMGQGLLEQNTLSIFMLRQTKDVGFLKKRYMRYPEELQAYLSEQSNKLQIYKTLLRIDYINMQYLYRQQFGYHSIRKISQFSTLRTDQSTPPHYQYYLIIEQDNYQYVFKNSYENPYCKGLNLFHQVALQKGKYFNRLGKNNKIRFIEQLYSIIGYASQRLVQLLNLNMFTIKLTYSPTMSIFVPQFDDLQLCRIYTNEIREDNRRLYQSYFQLVSQQSYKCKYIQNQFSILNYPPYNWQFQQQIEKRTIIINNQYKCQYDIGNLGYFLSSLLFFKRSKKDVKQSFQQNKNSECLFHKVYGAKIQKQEIYNRLLNDQYRHRIDKLHKQIIQDFFQKKDNQFYSFLLKSIHPYINGRLNDQQAISALQNTNQWSFD